MKKWIKRKLKEKIICRKEGNCEFEIVNDNTIFCPKCGTIWEEIKGENWIKKSLKQNKSI